MNKDNGSNNGEMSFPLLVETNCGQMNALAGRLDSLIQSREDEFLSLGSSLMEFTSLSQGVSDGASELASLCAGDDVSEGAASLSRALAELQSVCGPEAASASLEALRNTMGLIEQLDQQVGEFSRIIRSLQMLGISTRIESARLGDQGLGFSTLADDVETLANKIVTDSSAIAGKSSELAGLVTAASERTSALADAQAQCGMKITSEINEALDTLIALMGRAREVSSDVQVSSDAVRNNVAEVVSSLQFHDIVRQQVEHVEEALNEAVEQVAQTECLGREDEEGIDCWKNLVGWTADVSELQVSQLENASERFDTAVRGLRDGLLGISAQAEQLLDDIESIGSRGGSAGKQEGTVFSRVQETTGNVVGRMHDFSAQSVEIAELIGAVAGTISAMSGFVHDIEEVGSEIELIAINASIKAAHTGDEGKALGVLAQAIQRLSVEARDRTRAVSGVLMSVAEASEELETRSSDTTQTDLLDSYSDQQEKLAEVLSRLDADMSGGMEAVRAGSRVLGGDVRRLADSISIHEKICPGLDDAAEELRGIVAISREAVPVSDDTGRPERMKQLLSRYTMEVERLVHESAFGVENGNQSMIRHEDEGEVELFGDDDGVELFGDDEGKAPTSASKEEEDWDNIELF